MCVLLHWQGVISRLVCDEAHLSVEWAQFRHAFTELKALRDPGGPFDPTSCPARIPYVALTATANNATRRSMLDVLGMADAVEHIGSCDRSNCRYYRTLPVFDRWLVTVFDMHYDMCA
jgi:ATP-dependent DNA helicase RecQ